MTKVMASIFLLVLMCAVSLHAQTSPSAKVAFAELKNSRVGVFGGISFEYANNVTYINGGILNLTDGVHGLHIHESGDVEDYCSRIGDHYNPYGRNHSCDPNTGHLGDLGNIISRNGFASVNIRVQGMTLSNSNGKENNKNPGVRLLSIAVDRNFDTCQPELDGNSGPPVACGRIQ